MLDGMRPWLVSAGETKTCFFSPPIHPNEEVGSMRQSKTYLAPLGSHMAVHFGALLKTLRHRHGIKQMQVLAHLPGWTQTTYSRLETAEMAPAFDQLAPIYAALRLAGVEFTPLDRQQYLTLARTRIEAKKTYQEHKTDQECNQLRFQLIRV